MFKKLSCVALAICMIFCALCFVGCERTTEIESEERLPVTISVLGITDESTTDEAVKAVEDAINDIMGMTYSTHIDLTLVTADEYMDLVKERQELAEYYSKLDTAVLNYNNKAQSAANEATVTKSFGKWRRKISSVSATTVTTREQYTSIITELNEHGVLEVVYPKAASPIDVVMIIGEDMYKSFDADGVLASVKTQLESETYTKFSQFIYPTYFELLQAMTGDIKAIPNNNLLAEYTYILVNKELADKYELNIDNVKNYSDISDFLASVKAGETVTPMNTVPEALGIFKLFENDGVAIGTYCDPIIGYNVEESSYYSIRNLFEIPEFKAHASLMEEYENAGYFDKSASGDFAVDVIHGDASVEVLYGDDYYVKVLQNPFVEESAVFDGMLAVSSYSSNATRALEFILELTTNPELKNLFQYGIEDVNYVVNDDETITRLNRDYIMNTGTTGNVYKGYPEEGMLANQWEYVKKTNLDSLPNPYLSYKAVTLGYACNYYVNDETLDGILAEVLTRACMDEAFAEFGYTYDEYLKNEGTIAGYRMGDVIKKAAKYKDYFISEIMKDSGSTLTQATNLYNASSQGSAKYPYSWYFTKLVEKMTAEKYASLKTASSLNSAILEKIASLAGASLKDYDSAKTKAATYYGNIETLKIMARLVIWDGLDDDEWAYYDNMGAVEFETAVFNYVRDNYIEEYDLDDEKYDQLVKAFIVSQLKFTDPSDNSTYTITWDEYTEAKENAQDFIEVIDTLKETYHDRLVSYVGNQMLLSLYSDSDIPELVHDMLLSEWMNANGLKKNTYTTELYDEILSFMGITYSELTSTRKTDTTKFAEYMTKIKAQYKNVLIENFSMAQYKNGRISNDDVLTTLLNEKIEEKAGIYDAMCSELDITYSWYKSKLADMEKFVSYASQMRTKFTYTLLTVYSQSEIDNLSYNEIDGVVYGVISDSGFYMNELCSFICTDLGTYMTKKSDTKAYNTYIAKITSALKNELAAKGYTPEQVSTMNIPESSAILYDIVKEKYFSGITTIEQMLAFVSGEYVKGVDTASDVGAYIDEAYDATKANPLFSSLIYVLNTALEAALKTE